MSSVRRRTEASGSTPTSMGGRTAVRLLPRVHLHAANSKQNLCVSAHRLAAGPSRRIIANSRRGFDELTSRTRQRGRQTRACDQFVARPYRRIVGGRPASVCPRIFAARTGREGSLVPVGSHGVQRARNVASEKR